MGAKEGAVTALVIVALVAILSVAFQLIGVAQAVGL
jgi:hypothetical protein